MPFKVIASRRLLRKTKKLRPHKDAIRKILLELQRFPNVGFRRDKKAKRIEKCF